MRSLFVFAVILVSVAAQPYFGTYDLPPVYRIRRDLYYNRPVGNGRLFANTGINGYGQRVSTSGYQRNIFNDDRGTLDGSVYGTRVRGGGSSVGSGLNYVSPSGYRGAYSDVNHQLFGGTTLNGGAYGPRGNLGYQGNYY